MSNLSVIIPVFNEEKTIKMVISNVVLKLDTMKVEYEIIVVNDGSDDSTPKILSSSTWPLTKVLSHESNYGYGSAIKTGISNACNKWVIIIPSDGQFDIDSLHLYWDKKHGVDIVAGRRIDRKDSLFRLTLSRLYNLALSILFNFKVRDSGWAKLYRRTLFECIKIETDGFIIDTEVLMKAYLLNATIIETDVPHHKRGFGSSKIGTKSLFKTIGELYIIWKLKQKLINEIENKSIYRKKPITTKLPFHYHLIPGQMRFFMAKKLHRMEYKNPHTFLNPLFKESNDNIAQEKVTWPQGRKFAYCVTYDIDTIKGLKEILKIKTDTTLSCHKSTMFLLSHKYPLTDQEILILNERNWEIGLHGYNHDTKLPYLPMEQIEDRIKSSLDFFNKFQVRPQILRSPSLCKSELLYKALEKYHLMDSSFACDDGTYSCHQYIPFMQGQTISIPLTLPMDVSLLFSGISPNEIFRIWKDRFNYISSRGGVVIFTIHPEAHFYGGRKNLWKMIQLMEDFLTSLPLEQGWNGTMSEIGNYWSKQFVTKNLKKIS